MGDSDFVPLLSLPSLATVITYATRLDPPHRFTFSTIRPDNPTSYTKSGRQAVLAALEDVVTVNPDPQSTRSPDFYEPSSSYAGASPMSHMEPPPMLPSKNPFDDTSAAAPPPHPKSNMAGKFANAFRRQTAEEKEAKRREKEARMNKEISKSAAKSSRMDIIDRLDLSGIHGSSMFHHDSPYDACSPHNNRGKRAPVMAFDPNVDPMTGEPIDARRLNGNKGRSRLSPLAKHTLSKMDSSHSDLHGDLDEKPGASGSRPASGPNGSRSRSSTAPIVPSLPLDADAAASTAELGTPSIISHDEDGLSEVDRDLDADGSWGQGYHTQPSKVPSSRHDVSNPNADVWGVSAEPWQDFAQPKAREKGSANRHSTLSPSMADTRGSGDRSGISSAASSVFDMEAVMTGRYKKKEPEEIGGVSPFPEPNWNEKLGVTEQPKRSKSLIKRIRSMKENPNVPPPDDAVEMGNLNGRRGARRNHKYSPSTPPARFDAAGSPEPEAGSGIVSSRAAADAAVGIAPGASLGRKAGGGVTSDYMNSGSGRYGGGHSPIIREESADRSPGETAPSGGAGGGLGRSGSLFNKFGGGRKKGAKAA
ncbi:hypothetical protein IE53DRAFT_407821 [Violaceomyces palustris]|uniref:Uncharacterized protein n=1 Tax=Violaceomyces palustris TaxID=1673888 RepID=A0ACD0NLN7_9BASI|nr:hypothetical protein IE53DRAFT_407821 [Violaceomyces palustris]